MGRHFAFFGFLFILTCVQACTSSQVRKPAAASGHLEVSSQLWRAPRFTHGSVDGLPNALSHFRSRILRSGIDVAIPDAIAERIHGREDAILGEAVDKTRIFTVSHSPSAGGSQVLEVFGRNGPSDENPHLLWKVEHSIDEVDNPAEEAEPAIKLGELDEEEKEMIARQHARRRRGWNSIVAAMNEPGTDAILCILRNGAIRRYFRTESEINGAMGVVLHRDFWVNGSKILNINRRKLAQKTGTRLGISALKTPGHFLIVSITDPTNGTGSRGLSSNFEVVSLDSQATVVSGESKPTRVPDSFIKKISVNEGESTVLVTYDDESREEIQLK